MIGYNPSHLNTNETLLEAFHRVEAYLKANPQYQVYQSSATYQEGTQEYALDTIVVPEGSTVGKGDVVLFSNVYYAVITAVSETTFSVGTATNFRGAQGEQGPKGDTGATGDKGETGLPALMYSKNVQLGPYQSFSTDLDGYNRTPQINDVCAYYSSNTNTIVSGTIEEIRPDTQQVFVRKIATLSVRGPQGPAGPKGENGKDGNATLLYAGELSESITTVEAAQITRPQNRGILVKDILISTAASTFGAMAQVTALPVGVTTVDVSFIGTLESGGGSGVSDYNELANIPVINQDLSASGFTPTANTYYRHTGATTGTFTQGVIYLYDTAYHKLGESGGATLNKYTYAYSSNSKDDTSPIFRRIVNIIQQSKGKVIFSFTNENAFMNSACSISCPNDTTVIINANNIGSNIVMLVLNFSVSGSTGYFNKGSSYIARLYPGETMNGNIQQADTLFPFRIDYYNDTELT